MASLLFEHHVRSALLIGLGLLILVSVAGYRGIRDLNETAELVAHSRQLEAHLSRLLGSLGENESGQRGFQLTGNDGFLGPYYASLGRIRHTRAELATLALSPTSQRDQLSEIDRLLARWLATAEVGVARRRQLDPETSPFPATRESQELLATIRQRIAELTASETRLRADRQAASDSRSRVVVRLVILASVLGVVVAGLAAMTTGRQLRWRRRAEDTRALEQREHAERLRESEAHYRQIVHTANEGIWVLDNLGQTRFVNERMAEMLGYEPAAMVGRALAEFCHPDELVRASEHFGRNLDGYQAQFDCRLRRADGSLVSVLAATSPARDGGGTIVGALGMYTDVTARRQLEHERAKFEHLVENSSDYITLADLDARLEYINRAGLSMIGASSLEAVLRRPMADLLTPESAVLFQTRVLPTVRTTGRWDGEMQLRHLVTGEAIQVHRSIFLVNDPTTGLPAHLGSVTRDIRAERRLAAERERALVVEQQLRHRAESASRAKDEFLAMLGHELRNPLAPIKTALHLMRLRAGAGEDRERAVLERQVTHLVALVDDLLDITRITQGKVQLQVRRLAIADVVARAVETVQPLLEQQAHHLTLDLPHSGCDVIGDAERLAQVISNLLTNAAKYTEPGGHIAVTARAEDEQIVVRVRDDGTGIAPEMLPRVFDLFAQETQGIDRPVGGLGLGLAIVKNLVTLHHGTVEARSSGRGQGSEFVVRLPTAPVVVDTVPQRERPTRMVGRPLRVLVVDDNEDAARTLADALRALGHTVRVAYDGPSALHLATAFRPDVALMDIGLPVMDGYELAQQFQRRPELTRTRLIALTGYGQENDRRRSAQAGFAEHLVKPVDIEIVQGLLAALAESSAGRQLTTDRS